MRALTRGAGAVTLLAVIATAVIAATLAQPAGARVRTSARVRSATRAGASSAAVRTLRPAAEPGLDIGVSGGQYQLTGTGATSVAAWTRRTKAAGAQIVRLGASWSSIAPATRPAGFDAASQADPSYDWSALDEQVRQLTAEGFKVILEVQGAPTWAEGPGAPRSATPGSWEPNATDFGQFATALATRYDGHTADPLHPGRDLPRISEWQAWNEPNLGMYLAPQWTKSGSRYIARSPAIYRDLENAFYRSVKAASSTNYVVAAGTAPYGDPPGGARMSPVTFDQNLLCLTGSDTRARGCPGPTYMNAIDDHPYVSGLCCEGPTWHAKLPDDTSIADMYKIVRLLKAAERERTVAPAGPKGVWASELGWDTDPPDPVAGLASPVNTVARWTTQALYVLWAQGVHTVLWYQLQDQAEARTGWTQTLTEGLYYVDGRPKAPIVSAFAFPFLTFRRSHSQIMAWGRSPRSGTLTISERHGRGWSAVLALRVRADQVFEVPLSLTGSADLRANIGRTESLSWSQGA